MKKILLALLLFSSTKSFCQVSADPATGQMDITALDGTPSNANFIAPNTTMRLKVPVYNLNQLNAIPAGSCKLKIGLGNLLSVDPSFSLASAPLSSYFTWTSTIVAGEVQITGDLVSPLPGDFTGLAEFNIKGAVLGTSEIGTNFNVTNHNTIIPLIDEDPNNNFSTLQYTITNTTIPVTFSSVNVSKSGCTVHVRFTAENEINVGRYEIEAGSDGIHYDKLYELKADARVNYAADFNYPSSAGAPSMVYIRIKSVDKDGRLKYSETRILKGVCEPAGAIHLLAYPNPVVSGNLVKIRSLNNELLNGHFQCTLCDITGRIILSSQMYLTNSSFFIYKTGDISAGNYLLKVWGNDKNSFAIVKIVKL